MVLIEEGTCLWWRVLYRSETFYGVVDRVCVMNGEYYLKMKQVQGEPSGFATIVQRVHVIRKSKVDPFQEMKHFLFKVSTELLDEVEMKEDEEISISERVYYVDVGMRVLFMENELEGWMEGIVLEGAACGDLCTIKNLVKSLEQKETSSCIQVLPETIQIIQFNRHKPRITLKSGDLIAIGSDKQQFVCKVIYKSLTARRIICEDLNGKTKYYSRKHTQLAVIKPDQNIYLGYYPIDRFLLQIQLNS